MHVSPWGVAARFVFSGSREPEREMTKETVTAARIVVDDPDDCAALWEWLLDEPDLRGHLRRVPAPPPAGAMGPVTEIVLTATAAGAVSGLIRALTVWLTQLRSDITVKVVGREGRQVSLSGKRVRDAEALLRTVLDHVDADHVDVPAPGPEKPG